MPTKEKDVWVGGDAWLRTLRRVDIPTDIAMAQHYPKQPVKQPEAGIGSQYELRGKIPMIRHVEDIVQEIKRAAGFTHLETRAPRDIVPHEISGDFTGDSRPFDGEYIDNEPAVRHDSHLNFDTDKLFATWRIDDKSREQLRQHLPMISSALGRYRAHLYQQLLMDGQVELLLPDEELRSQVTTGIMDYWSELLGGEIDRDAILRAAAASERCFDLGVPLRAFLVVSQHILWLAIDSLIVDGIYPETQAAIDVISRVVMMSADVVLTIYARSLTAASAVETAARKQELDALKADAYVDSLTGLFNRRYFDKVLAVEVSRSIRQKQPLCLIIADIDLFKRVNDSWGHTAGDTALVQVAHALHSAGRLPDIVTRYGGEEFAIILPNTRVESAHKMAERLRTDIANHPIKISGGRFVPLTMSLGVSILGSDKSISGLVESADAALYRAKQKGRNCVEVGLPHAVYSNTRKACRAFEAAEHCAAQIYSDDHLTEGR